MFRVKQDPKTDKYRGADITRNVSGALEHGCASRVIIFFCYGRTSFILVHVFVFIEGIHRIFPKFEKRYLPECKNSDSSYSALHAQRFRCARSSTAAQAV